MKINKEFFKQFTDDTTFAKLVELNNIVELLNRAKTLFGNCNASLTPNNKLVNFNTLFKDTNNIANNLTNLHQANIALICDGNYYFEVASLAIMASGNCAVLIPSSLDSNTISNLLIKFDIELIVCDQHNLSKINSDIKKVVIDQAITSNIDHICFAKDIKNDDNACILLTSGTTGKSKGVVLSHKALMSGTINGCYGLKKVLNQTYYCLIPLTNSFGLIRNMLCSIYTGSLIYFNIDKTKIFNDLVQYKPTVLILVPALAELFLNIINNVGLQALGGNVHTIICGSANVPPYLPKQYEKLGITFCPGYGLTEFANIVTGNPQSTTKSDSVGFLFPNQEAKIVDGELYLKGSNMFKYYYKQPLETKEAICDGWFRTGDLARIDKDNHIYIVGRIKNLIVLSSGEKISPEYIESKVNKLDLVKDSMVYCNTNDFGIESIVCELTIRPNILKQLNLLPSEVNKYIQTYIDKVNTELLPYQQIKKIIIRDKDFDRNSAMKIIRKRG